MTIRVFFLGGAALKDGRQEPRVLVGLGFMSLTSQEMSEGREGRLGRGVVSENLAEPSPSELQPKFCGRSEVQRALRAVQLLWASPPGSSGQVCVGWELPAEAAGRQGGALDGESREPGS